MVWIAEVYETCGRYAKAAAVYKHILLELKKVAHSNSSQDDKIYLCLTAYDTSQHRSKNTIFLEPLQIINDFFKRIDAMNVLYEVREKEYDDAVMKARNHDKNGDIEAAAGAWKYVLEYHRHYYKYYDEALNALFKAKQYLWYTIAYNEHLRCRVHDRQQTIISNSRLWHRQKQKDMCESSLLLERIQCGDALQTTTGIVFTGHIFHFTDDCLQRSDDRFLESALRRSVGEYEPRQRSIMTRGVPLSPLCLTRDDRTSTRSTYKPHACTSGGKLTTGKLTSAYGIDNKTEDGDESCLLHVGDSSSPSDHSTQTVRKHITSSTSPQAHAVRRQHTRSSRSIRSRLQNVSNRFLFLVHPSQKET
jgi:hypothetical protein